MDGQQHVEADKTELFLFAPQLQVNVFKGLDIE